MIILLIKVSLNNFLLASELLEAPKKLYVLVSQAHFFNHSCDSNVIMIYKNNQIKLFTTRPINQNEELRINYLGFTTPFYIKQRYLSETHFFSCDCKICKYEHTKNYFCNLHRVFKKKVMTLDLILLFDYLDKNFQILTHFEYKNLVVFRTLIYKILRAEQNNTKEPLDSQKIFSFFTEFLAKTICFFLTFHK